MRKARDFQKVIERVKTAVPPLSLATLAEVNTSAGTYPILALSLTSANPRALNILLSAGIHGDEPAGVETICSFLEKKAFARFRDKWSFHFLPCLNPFGFEHDTRHNQAALDLNRLFKSSPGEAPPELRAIFSFLRRRFDLSMELHEDSDSPGYYIYQKDASATEASSLGRQILRAVEEIVPLNRATEIEGLPADEGLLWKLTEPQDMTWWPMAFYVIAQGASLALTLETPTQLELPQRVAAHLAAIETALTGFDAPAGI